MKISGYIDFNKRFGSLATLMELSNEDYEKKEAIKYAPACEINNMIIYQSQKQFYTNKYINLK